MTKNCTKCKIEKPLDAFYSKRDGRYGVAAYCKICVNAYMRPRSHRPDVVAKRRERYAARKDDPEFIAVSKFRSAKHYGTVAGRAKSLLRSAMKSPDGCSVTLEHIMSGIERGHCLITGIAFDLSIDQLTKCGRHTNPFAPSLDRENPNLGYTDENTRVVIWQYNLMKGELSDAETLTIARALVARHAT